MAPEGRRLPRYSRRSLPRRRYLPGRGTRPPEAGPQTPGASAARFDPRLWWECEGFLHGADLWNRGFFWEAHEAWEGPWRHAGRESAAGRFLQGLILLAAAGVKRELGWAGPARRLADRGARRLGESRLLHPGFDPRAFAAAVRAWLSAGPGTPPPPLALELPAADGEVGKPGPPAPSTAR